MALILLGTSARAHEKWFVDEAEHPLELGSVAESGSLWYILASLLFVAVAYALWRWRGGRGLLPGPELFGASPSGRSILYSLVPFILGVHLAVPLLIAGVRGTLLAPGVQLEGAWLYLLGLAQTGVALSFFYGGFTRPAALALGGLWLLGFWATTPLAMLENVHLLGFAFFFYLAGRGPLSIDRLIFPRLQPPRRLVRHAVPALRIAAGLSFVVVAFSEKLANTPLALAFLERYDINFTGSLGLPLPDLAFVQAAGAIELAIGLLLVLGIFVRETIVVAWLPFNLTLTVFNWVELVGHLPFYGIMALLLVFNGDERDRRLWEAGVRGEDEPSVDESRS